jgi:hypothetical protein
MPPASTPLTNIAPLKARIVRMLVFNLITVISPWYQKSCVSGAVFAVFIADDRLRFCPIYLEPGIQMRDLKPESRKSRD